MSKIDALVDELCPNGTVYRAISEIANISRGQVMSKDFLRDNAGEYPVYSSQTENNGMLGKITTYMFDGEYLTWTTDGANAGTVFYRNGKFSVTNVCGVVDVTDDAVSTKYLFYALNREAPQYVNKGMGNPKLMSNVMARIRIPIPPLPVQQEIVRILDNFTELMAELNNNLKEELTARRKQYEYYRDELLTFGDDVPRKKLVDSCDICRGVRVVRKQLSHADGYPVFQNSLAPLGFYDKANCCANTSFIITAGAAGSIGYSTTDFWAADDCYFFKCDKNVVLDKFLFYVLDSQQEKILSMVRKASIPRIGRSSIENLIVPLPQVSIQMQIVSVLDRFDALCNDLSSGLPAEIAARQKQYEYYRDKLLTFKELEG